MSRLPIARKSFLDLPREIRQQILEYAFEPVYEDDMAIARFQRYLYITASNTPRYMYWLATTLRNLHPTLAEDLPYILEPLVKKFVRVSLVLDEVC